MEFSDMLLAVAVLAIVVPSVVVGVVIGVPMALQFANNISSRISINAANATEETAASGRQNRHQNQRPQNG